MDQIPDSHEHSVSPEEAAELAARIRAKENFLFGVIAGVVSALVGACIWAAVTVITGIQIGWMAVGVGFMVGYAIRLAGKGETERFSYLGAACALFGCALGNYFSIIGFIANQESMGVFEVLTGIDQSFVIMVMRESFSPIDMLFYGLAIYGGYKHSVTH